MNLRETSKKQFDSNDTVEHINAGSLQRIADATQKMAANYIELQEELERYKRRYQQKCDILKVYERQISAYKGQITKLKRRYATEGEHNG